MKNIETKICEKCRKRFEKNYKYSKKQWSRAKFCSIKCLNLSRKGKTTSENFRMVKYCKQCGKKLGDYQKHGKQLDKEFEVVKKITEDHRKSMFDMYNKWFMFYMLVAHIYIASSYRSILLSLFMGTCILGLAIFFLYQSMRYRK